MANQPLLRNGPRKLYQIRRNNENNCHYIGEGQTLSAYKISMSYLNLRLSYYYFRFRITDNRHIEILLPVSISTYPSSPSSQIA